MENLLAMDFLPRASEGRRPLLKGVLKALPEGVPAVREGLPALARLASSLRFTEATLSGPAELELLGGVAGEGSILWDDW